MERDFTLEGLDRAVYLAAGDATARDRVAAIVAERYRLTAGAGEVAAAVERLMERALVLTVDRRLVALGLSVPPPPLPGLREFPGGLVEEGARQWA